MGDRTTTHLTIKHRVWTDSGRCMSQIVVLCGGARVEDRLTYDRSLVTCLECIVSPPNPKVMHIQLFADGLPIPEVKNQLLANIE